jgi:TP901 family phage tail tape measure protein
MALNISHSIDIIFQGIDQVSDEIEGIGDKIKAFGSGLSDFASPFAEAAKSVLALDIVLNTAVVAGLSAASAKAVDFKQAMNEINVIGQFTPAVFDELKTKSLAAFDAIKSTDMDGYMKALNQTVAFGVTSIPDIFNAIKIGEDLSIAGTAKLDETIVGLLGTMNAYGAGQEEMARYAGAFFQITQDGNASVADLSAYLSGVTATAAGAKIPFETIGAAIAALTAQGVPASQAITAINSSIAGIIAPTGEAETLMKQLGIQYGSAGIAAIGYDGILKQIYEKTNGNVDLINKIITSEEARKGVLLLGADAAGKFAGALENMKDTSQAVAGGVKRSTDEMEKSLQQLVNAWDKMQTAIGLKIPAFNANIIEPFTKLFQNIGMSIDAGSLDEVFAEINKFGDKLKKYLTDMANAAPEAMKNANFSGLLESYEKLTEAAGKLFEGIDLSTPEGLTKALQLVIDTMESLNRTSAGIVEVFQPVFAAIKEGIEWYNTLSAANKELIGNLGGISIILTSVGGAFTVLSGIVGALSGPAALAWTAFSILSGGFIAITAAAAPLIIAFAGVRAGVEAFYYYTDEKSKKKIDDMAQGFIAWADSLIDWTGTHNEAGESADEVTAKLIAEAKAAQQARISADAMKDSLKSLSDSKFLIGVEYDIMSIPEQTEKISKALEELTAEKRVLEISLKDATGEEKTKILNRISEIDAATSALSDKETQIQIDLDTRSAEEILSDPEGYFYKGDKPVVNVETKVETAKAKEQFEEFVYEVNGKEYVMRVAVDKGSAEKTKEDLEKIVPPEKQLRILADIDIAKIKEQSAIVQQSIEWKAKLDIAEVEANAKIVQSQFESISNTITSTGDVISEVFGVLADLGNSSSDVQKRWMIEDQLERENELRAQALELQKETARVQNEYLRVKTEMMKSGKGLMNITIDGINLEADLRSMTNTLLAYVQMQANQEGLESLLGLL